MSWAIRIRGARNYLWAGVRWGLALLLAGLAGWLSMRQVHWATLRNALAQVDIPLLALALSTVLATTAAKAARWALLLRPCCSQIDGMRVLRVLLIGQMGNSFLPARLGDLARAALLSPQAAGGFFAVLGTILVEKTLDGMVGLCILAGLALWTPLPSWLRGPALALVVLTGTLLAVLLLAATRQRWIIGFYQRSSRWLPEGTRASIHRMLASLAMGLDLFKHPANALLALTWSAAVWGLAALTNLLLMAALDIDAPGWSTWLVLVTGYIANFLPTVPAQVGVFEYASVLALTVVGIAPEPALAFALLLHLLVYAPPAVLGPVSMAIEGASWAKLRAAGNKSLEQDRVVP
jgi:uncharacterized protein (TIRG00374 family)